MKIYMSCVRSIVAKGIQYLLPFACQEIPF